MSFRLALATMISVIFFVVVYAIKLRLSRMNYPKNPKSELTRKITKIFQYTVLGIGVAIVLTNVGLGIDIVVNKDISGWVSLIIGTGIGIGISIVLYVVQQDQNNRLENQNKQIRNLVTDVHTVSDYLGKRLKGKERYTALTLHKRLQVIIRELEHQLGLYEKWKIEQNPTTKENFGNSMIRSYDRCFPLNNTGLSPIELRDVLEDYLAGMVQTAHTDLSVSSDVYFDLGIIDEEIMPSFIEHIKKCKETCENLEKYLRPLASENVKGA